MCEILNIKREKALFGLMVWGEGNLSDWLALCFRA